MYNSKYFKFLKETEYVIKNQYNLNTFIKSVKAYNKNKIVKLYVSQNKPLIIEYTLEDGIGIMCIFSAPIN